MTGPIDPIRREIDDPVLPQDPAPQGPGADLKDRSDQLSGEAVMELHHQLNEVRIEKQAEEAAMEAEAFAGEILNKVDPVTGFPVAMGPDDLLGAILETSASVKAEDRQKREHPLTDKEIDRVVNTLPPKKPDGITNIPLEVKPVAIQAMAIAYPSMNNMGILQSMDDRMSYSRAVMANEGLRSDIRAKMIQENLQSGRVIPEALSNDWYLAQGVQLPPTPDPEGMISYPKPQPPGAPSL